MLMIIFQGQRIKKRKLLKVNLLYHYYQNEAILAKIKKIKKKFQPKQDRLKSQQQHLFEI